VVMIVVKQHLNVVDQLFHERTSASMLSSWHQPVLCTLGAAQLHAGDPWPRRPNR
jgi:hypothetical protein